MNKTKIVFEKYYKGQCLESWTTIFDSQEELVMFMVEHQRHLIGEDYYIVIRPAKIYEKVSQCK